VLREILIQYSTVVAEHIAQLQSFIEQREGAPNGKPCRAIAALAEANGRHLLPAEADPAVKDAAIVGAATRMQHYKIAGYRCLLTYAVQIDAAREAAFFRRCLSDESAFLQGLRAAELLAADAAAND
jgi:ferritin-like metal-binding protein YciE